MATNPKENDAKTPADDQAAITKPAVIPATPVSSGMQPLNADTAGSNDPSVTSTDGPVMDITRFRQEFNNELSKFLGANASVDNQPKTFAAWMDQFYEWSTS